GECLGAADRQLVHTRDRRIERGGRRPAEGALEHDPQLSDHHRRTGEDDELDELSPRHVLVLCPVNGKVTAPLRLRSGRAAVRRRRAVIEVSWPLSAELILNHASPPRSVSAKTASRISWPIVGSCIAAVTSTISTAVSRGIMMFTLVRMVCIPNWKVLTGFACGRSRAISSRVPKASAWLGHADAHQGFSPTDVRS